MNASGELLVSARPRTMFGLRLCDAGWNAALGIVEGLISLRGNRTTLAFLDERTILRQAVDSAYRQKLSRRLLLPGGGRALSFLARMTGLGPAPVRYSARAFVPALLTYLERPHRIGIAGNDAGHVETLRDYLALHAPWHKVDAIPADGEVSGRFDLVVVDAKNLAQEKRIERRLASVRTGLIIMAGSDLSTFMQGEPARAASTKKQPAIPALLQPTG